MISYERLWETMRARGVTQYALIHTHHVSPGQITRLKRNESVSTHTIEVFCSILSCRVEDIMEYIPDARKEPSLLQKGSFALIGSALPPVQGRGIMLPSGA